MKLGGPAGFTGGKSIGGMNWKFAILSTLSFKKCKNIEDYKDYLDGPLLGVAELLIQRGELTQDDITWN